MKLISLISIVQNSKITFLRLPLFQTMLPLLLSLSNEIRHARSSSNLPQKSRKLIFSRNSNELLQHGFFQKESRVKLIARAVPTNDRQMNCGRLDRSGGDQWISRREIARGELVLISF